MTDSPVIATIDLGEFFREEVIEARQCLSVELSETIEFYLVTLLCDFSKRREALSMPGDEPLALLYKRALEAEILDKIQLLKHLGDVALYVSGFFTEFIERSTVDLDYYISMGGGAYSSLSDIMAARVKGEVAAQIYGEMGQQFTGLVGVLTEVADRSRNQASGDAAWLKLYDHWARTGSERAHRLLLEKGLVHTGPDELQ